MQLIKLIPVVEEFLVGNANTKEILPPGVVRQDEVIFAEVTSITAVDDTPVLWLDL